MNQALVNKQKEGRSDNFVQFLNLLMRPIKIQVKIKIRFTENGKKRATIKGLITIIKAVKFIRFLFLI